MHKQMKLAFLAAIIILILASCVYVLLPSDSTYYEKVTNHTYDFISLIVVVTVLVTFRSLDFKTRDGKRWFFLLLGLSLWFLADITRTAFIYLGIDPLPSLADIFYIPGYLSVFVAVMIKYLNIKYRALSKDYMNGFFVTFCIIAVAGYYVLFPLAMSGHALLDKLVMITDPLLDSLVILFAVIIISASKFDEKSLPWLGVCLGLALWAIADTMTAYYSLRGIESMAVRLMDLFFIAGLLAMGLGAFYRLLVVKSETCALPKRK